MDKLNHFKIMVVANGYVLVGDYDPQGMRIQATRNEYVFETFSALVKFLDENIEKPNKADAIKTDDK
jgi:hypothetical protein